MKAIWQPKQLRIWEDESLVLGIFPLWSEIFWLRCVCVCPKKACFYHGSVEKPSYWALSVQTRRRKVLLIYRYSRPTRCQRIISAWSILIFIFHVCQLLPASFADRKWMVRSMCWDKLWHFPNRCPCFQVDKKYSRSTVYWRLDHLKKQGDTQYPWRCPSEFKQDNQTFHSDSWCTAGVHFLSCTQDHCGSTAWFFSGWSRQYLLRTSRLAVIRVCSPHQVLASSASKFHVIES